MKYSAQGTKDNALESVVFIVEFRNRFSEQDFVNLEQLGKSWKTDLPRRSTGTAVQFLPHEQIVQTNQNKINSLSYEALARDGNVERGIRFEGSRILFIVGDYTSWDDVWPTVVPIFKAAIDAVSGNNRIERFSSEYNDRFRAVGDYQSYNASEVLKQDSPYTAPHIFKQNLNWHSHTGFFNEVADPKPHRILTRVNIDLKDNIDEKSRDLTIQLFHSILGENSAFSEYAPLNDAMVDRGLDNFIALHEFDKKCLAEIISDKMAKRIGLFP